MSHCEVCQFTVRVDRSEIDITEVVATQHKLIIWYERNFIHSFIHTVVNKSQRLYAMVTHDVIGICEWSPCGLQVTHTVYDHISAPGV